MSMNDNQGAGNTSVSEGLAAMISAHQSGQDLKSAFNNPTSVQTTPPVKTEESITKPQESQQETPAEQETVEAESETKESTSEDKTEGANQDVEEIVFTDHKGRRSVKVDFSDRDKLKKLASRAYGSQKFQVERDQARQELAKEREEAKAVRADMQKFESIYEKQGIKGLVMALEGAEGLKKFLETEKAEQDRWEDMTPSERNAEIRAREEAERASKAEESRAEYERRIKELDERQRAADEKAFESKLNPAFDRYRFAGKLGDPVAEHRLDKAIWTDVMDALQPYEDKGLEITQAIIDREFRKARQEWDKTVNKQVTKNTKVAVDKAKTTATSKAQAKVSQGMQTNAAKATFDENMKTGNIRDALGSFLRGEVKLNR